MNKLKPRPAEPGGLMPAELQQQAKRLRATKTLANAKADGNRWFYVALLAMILCIVMAIGWHAADKRFAENVRVAWVKLSPSGTYVVEYADEDKPIDYFTATVESKLSEYVEKRFSKRRETISTDYGFASIMQEPQLNTHFLENEKAAEVAAEVVDCQACPSIVSKVRTVQSIDKDLAPGSKKDQQYTTLVFTTFQTRDKGGRIVGCENKIVTLIWLFRPRSDIVKQSENLRYNPLGQGIVRDDIRNDPTPITEQECRKL